MAMTNHERVGKALEHLKAGLGPFVDREVRAAINAGSLALEKVRGFAEDPLLGKKPIGEWDTAGLLKLMWETWNEVFKKTLGFAERSLVSELRDWRNKWAHQEPFTGDDAYRVLDSAARLLTAVSAPQADEVERIKAELLRTRFDEQVRNEKRKVGGSLIEAAPAGALKPWREVVIPHDDVASGRYQQAEFAADLWQVHLGEGAPEYKDPAEFFRRTYLTESLKQLLVNGVKRLSGLGGDPVVQLQTNFGGGKTHSMLALYHLFSGVSPTELVGVEAILAAAGVSRLPSVRRVVLVGNKISPGNASVKPDGTVVRTLWGELAYQLGGKAAYARIAADDEHATSPGDALRELFNAYGPCLILIDEWVAYARQLHDAADLPAGSFETQFSFAQALTESAKLAKHCLLLVSLPASDVGGAPQVPVDDIEVGGTRGREALDRLRNVVGRIESSWRPASAEEGFEIVRRRLFQPLTDPDQFKQRDVVARAFADFYRANQAEFPPETRDADYESRIKGAYPIHPEIFDRLYTDWSTLVKFQRTRGVLRLMAAVIHCLWEKGDRNPLILPANIPIDDARVQSELTRYLSDNWVPVIEKDVDGPNSLPLKLDGELPTLGKFSACRRVARTIYLGSAPTVKAAHQGIEDRRVKLGCALPGEALATFGDALRRLSESATYLYRDGSRYWYSIQPTLTKLAEDRAEQLLREPEKVAMELEHRLKEALDDKADFDRIHPLPASSAEVPDDFGARLVVLGTAHPYKKDPGSAAETAAKAILEMRGNMPRRYRNTLAFLAADKTRLQDLEEAVRRFLAWQSILREEEQLGLTTHQKNQVKDRMQAADEAVKQKLKETYCWLLVPEQGRPEDPLKWTALRLSAADGLVARASRKLRADELLLTGFAATRLKMELDRIPLWRGDHVTVRQLVEDFASYLYLPRLKNPEVLLKAIEDGVALLTWERDSFALAEGYDEASGRYQALRAGERIQLTDPYTTSLVLKPERARRQMDAELSSTPSRSTEASAAEVQAASGGGGSYAATAVGPSPAPATAIRPKRFHGTVRLDPTRATRDVGQITEEVVAHLAGLVGATVTVTLEIEARIPEGAPEQVVRVVTENARTLKFEPSSGFERE
ncbi:MAG: Swt1 family HEPN domain-containing protein [Casimicrobiaceae bacterium]